MKVEISKLQPHPYNRIIYGYDENNELLERIKASGWIKPIVITPSNMILSGHRRVDCCKTLGYTEIECEIIEGDPVKYLEIMLSENQYRVKTTFQLLKEAEIYRDLEKQKAYKRQIETGKQNLGQSSDAVSRTPLEEKGRATEIVAEKIGMSESSYKRGLKVMKRIEEEEDPTLKEFFGAALNENIDATAKLIEKPYGFIKEVQERTYVNLKDVGKVVRELEKEETTSKTPLPPGKYQILLLDLTNRVDIRMLNTTIKDICGPDCVLFIWVKPYQVETGIEVSKKWGFRYASCFLWQRDTENVISDEGELCLVTVMGSPHSIIEHYTGATEKPDLLKRVINVGYQGWSRVEIFKDDGWQIW